MQLPREPRPGKPVDAHWGAAIVRYLRSITLGPGRDYTVRRTANGTTIVPRAARQAVSAAGETYSPPLTILPGDEGKVRVQYGTVLSTANGAYVEPTLGGVLLSHLPAPQLAISGDGYIYLALTVDSGGVVAQAEILFSPTMRTSTATLFHLQLGLISSYQPGPPPTFTIHQSTSGSQAYQRCGSTHLVGVM